MKRMLFNATQQEELRVAIVDGQKLLDIDIETAGKEQHKSNIYKAVITRVEPSLEACFVNYGEDRHGFLPFKEVARSLFRDGVDVRNATIKDALSEGQELMVQVEKEERGNKGAALTTFISLAGRYLVLMPNNPRGGGVSRRIEGEERQELRENMEKLELPKGMSVIARTAGIGRSVEELQWDLNYLLQLWNAVEGANRSAPGAFLIYHESSLVIRAIRDYFQPDIGEILIDTDEIYEQARQFMSHVMPEMVNRVKRYRDDIPLFSRFQIEHQIETAYSRVVPLPSGGSIVIDHTEALVSIDVNSARSTRGGDIETTAFNTNCEAAEEAARQMRLRDLGGLIVIDFIDMEVSKNRREIENRLKDALRHDRARVQMDKISRFGLIELSRQRLRPSLSEGSHITCPRCNGTGHIRDVESFSLQVLRILEEESMKDSSAAIHIQLPVDVAAFLLNEKRSEVLRIEARHKVSIIVIPNKYLETPRYNLERLKHDDPRLDESTTSYELAIKPDMDMSYSKTQKEAPKPRQEAIVKSISPDAPPPVIAPSKKKQQDNAPSLWEKILAFLGIEKAESEPPAKPKSRSRQGDRSRNRRRNRSRDRSREDSVTAATGETQVMDVPNEEMAMPKAPKQVRKNAQGEKKRERKPRNSPKNDAADKPDVPVSADADKPEAVVIDITEAIAAKAVDAASSGEEETRRRRRRGGRNRNRREHDNGAGRAEATERVSEAKEIDEMVDALMSETLNQNDLVGRDISGMPARQPAQKAEAVSFAPVASQKKQGDERVTPFGFYDTNDENAHADGYQSTLPLDLQDTREEAPSSASDTAIPDVDQDVSDFVTSPVMEQGRDSVREEDIPEFVIAEPVDASETLSLFDARFDADEAKVIAVDEPVFEPETIVHDSPVTAAEMPAGIQPEKPEMVEAEAIEDFSRILESAGLTMASTDPEKLKKVREQAEMTEQVRMQEAQRPGRRRRTSPPVVDEPLVQVDTRTK